jgi:hypothetical protein
MEALTKHQHKALSMFLLQVVLIIYQQVVHILIKRVLEKHSVSQTEIKQVVQVQVTM